MLLPSG